MKINSLLLSLNADNVDFDSWVEVAEVKKYVDEINYSGINDLNSSITQTEIKLRQSEYLMDIANNNRILDYAQIRYSKRDNLLFQDELSFGVGIRFPYSGRNVKVKNDFYIKRDDLNLNLMLKSQENLTVYTKLKQELKSLYDEFEFYNKDLGLVFSVLNSTIDIVSVEVENTKKIISNSNKIKALDVEKNILQKYLDILILTDFIINNPKRNFIKKGLPVLE